MLVLFAVLIAVIMKQAEDGGDMFLGLHGVISPSFLVLLVETRVWCSTKDKLELRMQESSCVRELCVAELIIVFKISRPTV